MSEANQDDSAQPTPIHGTMGLRLALMAWFAMFVVGSVVLSVYVCAQGQADLLTRH